jgi:hypothetical protein
MSGAGAASGAFAGNAHCRRPYHALPNSVYNIISKNYKVRTKRMYQLIKHQHIIIDE